MPTVELTMRLSKRMLMGDPYLKHAEGLDGKINILDVFTDAM